MLLGWRSRVPTDCADGFFRCHDTSSYSDTPQWSITTPYLVTQRRRQKFVHTPVERLVREALWMECWYRRDLRGGGLERPKYLPEVIVGRRAGVQRQMAQSDTTLSAFERSQTFLQIATEVYSENINLF